jgi:hypothetical protein
MASLSNITGKELIKFKSIGYRLDRQNREYHRLFKTSCITPPPKKGLKIAICNL